MENSHKVICIRRENKNKWERRVALTPKDCKNLITMGYRIIVQPSELRCYTDKQYSDVGCEINEDILCGDLIIGVKEVPLDYLYPNKTYMYFSHTIKGQPGNMSALKDILEKKIRLIDYECIKDGTGPKAQRLVAFGRFAGLAGAIDFLQGMGEFLIHKKIWTPFVNTGYSYMFPSVDDAKHSVDKVGKLIKKKLLPREICPFIIGVTSSGRVSQGVQEILKILPHEFIEPDQIENLFKDENLKKNPRRDIVYISVIESRHMYAHKDNLPFVKEDFYENPHNYISKFAERFLPYLNVLYHCMFWSPDQPKIITIEEAHDSADKKKIRLMGISDITCDIDGSIEFLQKCTTIENPFFTIDPITNIMRDDFKEMSENSILYHAVDHLPAEFPIDASKHFSDKLTPFIPNILASKYPCELEEALFLESINTEDSLTPEIFNACETWNGKLLPNYEYLWKELAKCYPEFKEKATNARERKKSN